MNVLDKGYIWLALKAGKMKERMKEFCLAQDGVANVVATIVVLLITVLLIAAFWTQLKEWVSNLMSTIFGTTFDDGGL